MSAPAPPRYRALDLTVDEARYLEELLGGRLDTLANWIESALLDPSRDPEAARTLARQRVVVRDIYARVRHAFHEELGVY